MTLQAYTTAIATITGTGSQVVTGVVDDTGASFTPKFFIFHNGSGINSTGIYWAVDYGFDDGTIHVGYGTADTSQFGLKISGIGVSGIYSILRYAANAFFGGTNFRLAYVSAIGLGTFTITYDVNDPILAGDSIIVTALGGDTLEGVIQRQGAAHQTGFSFAPTAAIWAGGLPVIGSATGTGQGGTGSDWGVAAEDLNQGAVAANVYPFSAGGGNDRFQAPARITPAGITLTAFGTSDYTTSSNTGTVALVLGGCRSACGSFLQPAATGAQEIVTGINNKFVLLMSAGTLASAGTLTDYASRSIGCMDGHRTIAMVTGESATNASLTGAHITRDDAALAFVSTWNAASTTLSAKATGQFNPDNSSFILNWQQSDGVAREIIWWALGDAPIPPPPPPPPPESCTRFAIRWLRRSPHVNAERIRLFCRRFELDLQRGQGVYGSPSVAPQIMFRISTDGGNTWSSQMTMGAGAAGDYNARSFINMLGSGDDFVFEVSSTDQVAVGAIANAYATFIEGTS